MTLFDRNPLDCHRVDELQQWVADLQNMLLCQRQVNRYLRDQNELVLQLNQKESAINDQLREKIVGLLERMAQHESGMVHHYDVRQN